LFITRDRNICNYLFKGVIMYILIDDDLLIRTYWKMKSELYQIPFLFFDSPDQFFKEKFSPSDIHSIFIDYYLSDKTCDMYLHKLSSLGYSKPYLTTACEGLPLNVSKLFKDVLGKSFPRDLFPSRELSAPLTLSCHV